MGAAFQRSIGRLPTLVWMHPFLKVTKLEFMELSPFPLRTCYKCMYVLLKYKSYHCMHRYLYIYNNGYHSCVQAPLCRASQPKAGISGTVRTMQSIFFIFQNYLFQFFELLQLDRNFHRVWQEALLVDKSQLPNTTPSGKYVCMHESNDEVLTHSIWLSESLMRGRNWTRMQMRCKGKDSKVSG